MSSHRQPIDDYLHHLTAERRLSPHTIAAYRRDFAPLIRHAGATPLAELTVADLRAALAQLRARGLSPKSIARHLSGWRGFYAYACRRLGYPANPCLGLRPPRAAHALPEVLAPDLCARILDSEADGVLEVRDRAMFELFYSSGLRLAELTGLDLGDIDPRSGEARVTGKGRKTRIVPVGTQAVAALAAWLPLRQTLVRPGGGALFVGRHGDRLSPRSVERRLERWALRAGLTQHVHPHMLRHAFATHVLQSSGDLRAVQELLGHASIATTQVYTHLDWQHLARVYDQAHPRARRKT